MFIELVDILRCAKPHGESWLVVSMDEMFERNILRGMLGCPICLCEYTITEGVVDFGGYRASNVAAAPDPERAMRIAAALDLTDPRGVAILHGSWAPEAPLIRSITTSRLLLVNPSSPVELIPELSTVQGALLTFAAASVQAAAIDASADGSMIASIVNAVKPGGRLVGPHDLAIPHGVREIARDDEMWVGEKQSGLVRLQRGARGEG